MKSVTFALLLVFLSCCCLRPITTKGHAIQIKQLPPSKREIQNVNGTCPTSHYCSMNQQNVSCSTGCCCQGTCYDPDLLSCSSEGLLCPPQFSACFIACYLPSEFHCKGDQLIPLINTPEPEVSPSPSVPSVPSVPSMSSPLPPPPPPPPTGGGNENEQVEDFSIRINVGGGSVRDSDGREWAADQNIDGTMVKNVANQILFTPVQELYQTYRTGQEITYKFSVKPGLYRVSLYWSENDESVSAGSRALTVYINNDAVIQGLDILSNTGKRFAPLSKTAYHSSTNEGTIEVKVTGASNPAILSALELVLVNSDSLGPNLPTNSCNKLNPWMDGTPSQVVHSEGAAVALGTKLFLFAGFNSITLTSSPRVDAYDIESDSWEQRTDFPISQGITHIQSVAWTTPPSGQTARYIFLGGGFIGGNGGPATNKVFRYDTIQDSFSSMPDLPESIASGSLVIDNEHKLHYISGVKPDRATANEKHWVLDLTNSGASWVEEPGLPLPRNHIQGRTINNKIYVSGGQFNHDPAPGTLHQSLSHVYDIASKTWTQFSSQPMPRSHVETSSLVINDRLVLFGGRTSNWDNAISVIEFDPGRDTWSWLQPLPEERLSPAAGFFSNVSFKGVRGDYVVVTCGMAGQEPFNTWIAQVSLSDCSS